MQQMELIHIAKSLFDSIASGASPFQALTFEAGRMGQVIATANGGLKGLLLSMGVIKIVTKDATAAITAGEVATVSATGATVAQSAANEAAAASATTAATAETALAAASLEAAGGGAAAAGAAAGVVAGNEAIAESAATAATAEAIALGPITLILLGIAAAVAVVVGGFAIATNKIGQAAGDISKDMKLTQNDLDILKKKGVGTSVTMGDAFQGLMMTIGDSLSGLKPVFDWLGGAWKATLDVIVFLAVGAFKMIGGNIAGTINLIGKEFSHIPQIIGDAFITGVNAAISAVNWLGNKVIDFINSLGGSMKNFEIQGFVNPFKNATADNTIGAYAEGFNGFTKSVDAFGDAWVKNSKKVRENKITKTLTDGAGKTKTNDELFTDMVASAKADTAMEDAKAKGLHMTAAAAATLEEKTRLVNEAQSRGIVLTDQMTRRIDLLAGAYGEAYAAAQKPAKTPHGPKTEAAKFDDIFTSGQNDVNTEQARGLAAGVDMTAEAATALTEKTKLLNDAQSKGIALNDIQRVKIDALADAYARAKVTADDATASKKLFDDGDKDLAAIQAQTDMIGLYGAALATAAEKAKLLADAKSSGMSDTGIKAAMPGIDAKAGAVGTAQAEQDRKAFMEAARLDYVKNTQALAMQRAEIGMSADEITRYEAEQRLLNDAVAQHVQLLPADIDLIKRQADEMANGAIDIRKYNEAMDFAKDATKGFVSDLRSGLESGKGFWKSFADATLNFLDKIIQKMEDKAIDDFFNAMSGGGSGGSGSNSSGGGSSDWFATAMQIAQSFFNASGGAYDNGRVTAYARGGSFTNSIVDKPTMFASGGALGVMGEAGPEGILPLQRGPDGNLGVSMYGQGGSSGDTHVSVEVNNHYVMQGAMTSNDVVSLVKQGAEQTKRDVKENVQGWLQQQQNDGTVSG